jgi:hypothetical protein
MSNPHHPTTTAAPPDYKLSKCVEVISGVLSHEGPIIGIDFSTLQAIFATTAVDSLITIWTYDRRILCHIQLHGVSQSIYFQLIPKESSGNILQNTTTATTNNNNNNNINTFTSTTTAITTNNNINNNNNNANNNSNEYECLLISHKANIMIIDSRTFLPKNASFAFPKKFKQNIVKNSTTTNNDNNHNDNDNDDNDNDDNHNTIIECSAASLNLLEQIEGKARLRKKMDKLERKRLKIQKERDRLLLLRKQKLVPDTFIALVKKYISLKKESLDMMERKNQEKYDRKYLTEEEIVQYCLFNNDDSNSSNSEDFYHNNNHNYNNNSITELRLLNVGQSESTTTLLKTLSTTNNNYDDDDNNNNNNNDNSNTHTTTTTTTTPSTINLSCKHQSNECLTAAAPSPKKPAVAMTAGRYFALSRGVSPRVRIGKMQILNIIIV